MTPTQTSELVDLLLPRVVKWVTREEALILRDGVALAPADLQLARLCGVAHPERVRLLKVATMPSPDDPLIQAAQHQSGFKIGEAAGLTLGYGIVILEGDWGNRAIIAHELVHIGQYERLGGNEPFLLKYLSDFLNVGYINSPLEREACEVSRRVLEVIGP